MATITTLRPSATTSGVGWSAVPSGTLSGVTSDNNDATYALWSGSGSPMILATPIDSPPVGERRHQVRLQARGEDGDAWWAVRLSSGALVAGAAASFSASPNTVVGSWGTGVPADGSTILSCYITGQSTGVKINELYLDVDTREAPTFTPHILDGSGTESVTISDTVTPTLRVDSLDLDGLNARQYRFWVTSASVIVWDSGIVSGSPTNQLTSPLANGPYVAHYQVWSTLGSNTEYPSTEQTLSFSLSVGTVPAPDNPIVDQIDGTPFYTIEACAPDMGEFDGDTGYLEIQRVDCAATATSLAVLGPLATAACDTWTDYTLPRSGVGRSCDHDPEPCCSYYRARTVGRIDGSLVVSAWSDAFEDGAPFGLIVMWPGTSASIPSGWNRVTALDGKYPKGVPNSSTQPGTTGGNLTHTHTVGTHTHDTSHIHTATTPTAAATGTVNAPNTAGALKALTTHTHTRPSTDSATVVSGTATPSIATNNNEPSRLEVLFISSDGTPTGVPNNGATYMGDIAPAGWTTYTDATDRYPKGSVNPDGGGTGSSLIANHVHAIGAHTHTGTSHAHTSATTGNFSSTLAPATGTGAVTSAATHNHPITVASASTQSLVSGGSGNAVATSPDDPPYRNLRFRQNTSGTPDMPVGIIGIWRGHIAVIPDFWQLCDGTNGTPDMSSRYARAATTSINGTGGSLNTHTHTSPTHNHTTTGHAHTSSTGVTSAGNTTASTTVTVAIATSTHTHALVDTDATTPTVANTSTGTLAAVNTEPPFEQVAFIQLMSEPTPPPDPETFCLEWEDNEHLIRTTGPDGPLWVPVGGMFEWTVDRPFTAATGVNGNRFVTSAPPGGRNLHMTAAVESEEDLAALHAVLARPLVLISPSDADEVWAAPVAESVKIIKIGRIRQVTADFIGTGPQPEPQLADVGA